MPSMATALVQTAPFQQEFREIPLPVLGEGAGLLRVEANGICGTDVESFAGVASANPLDGSDPYPRIMGHEIVGVIEDLGPNPPKGIAVGDRVAVNPFIACGHCRICLRGDSHLCRNHAWAPAVYGFLPLNRGSGLWGGYSTHAYLDPKTVLYKLPSTMDPVTATLYNPLANAISWAVLTPELKVGDSIAILGSGQRGIACVVAARHAGAGLVLSTGLSGDAHKLALAREFGANVTVDVEHENLVDRAMEATGGEGFDVVVDTTPHAMQPLRDGLAILRSGGTLVHAGIKAAAMDDFPVDRMVYKGLRMIGVASQSNEAYQRACDFLATTDVPVEKMRTHTFGFDQFELALNTLQGKVDGANAVSIAVTPTFSGT